MAKYTKPDYSEQWASAGNIVAPNSVKIQTGHIVEKPNYEYMNWIQNRQDTGIAYALQLGITEWDNATQYQYTSNSHASFVQRNGVVYKAIQTGVNKDPLTEAAYWTIAFDDKGLAATVQSNLTTHITNYGTLAGLSNTTTARTNLDVYSKDDAAQKNGDATKLFSVANGTTGNEAVNKSQLDTKAPIAGNTAQEFAVAEATTGDSAVNKTQFDAKTGLATDTVAGIVEKATQAEMNAGTANVWPDAATIFNGFSLTTNTLVLPAFMGSKTFKWGQVVLPDNTGTDDLITVTFPQPFPDSLDVVLITTGNTLGSGRNRFILQLASQNTSGFTAWYTELESVTQAGFINWFAIGK